MSDSPMRPARPPPAPPPSAPTSPSPSASPRSTSSSDAAPPAMPPPPIPTFGFTESAPARPSAPLPTRAHVDDSVEKEPKDAETPPTTNNNNNNVENSGSSGSGSGSGVSLSLSPVKTASSVSMTSPRLSQPPMQRSTAQRLLRTDTAGSGAGGAGGSSGSSALTSPLTVPSPLPSSPSSSVVSPRVAGVESSASAPHRGSSTILARPLPSVAKGLAREHPVISAHSEWLVESSSDFAQNPELAEVKDAYAELFGRSTPHVLFAVAKEGDGVTGLVAVAKTPTQQFPALNALLNLGPGYRALWLNDAGCDEFFLHNVPLQRGGSAELAEDLAKFLQERLVQGKALTLWPIEAREAVTELCALEAKHSRRLKGFKVAVLYVQPGQTDMAQIFANRPPEGHGFWTFLDRIAQRVSLNGWDKYRGDMGKTGEDAATPGYYAHWRGVELMLHVAPLMSAEQHRRLCGNDIGVLIYYDAPAGGATSSFVPFSSIAMGTVPHVFAVAQPHASADGFYRLGFMQRPAVGEYRPQCPPATHYFSTAAMREFLLTKLHNGVARAQAVPPMDRLFKVPRRAALKSFGEKFGAESKVDKQRREKAEARLREVARAEAPLHKMLTVRVGSGRGLASKDANGLSDPLLELTLLEQQQRTKVIKKSLSPHWNEQLEFDLTALDESDELTLVCWDWNAGLFANERKNLTYMGEVRFLLRDVPFDSKERWWPLVAATADHVSGEIELAFTLKTEHNPNAPTASASPRSVSDAIVSGSSSDALQRTKSERRGNKDKDNKDEKGSKESKDNKDKEKEERQKVIADSLQQVFGY